jgi:multidrug efflux pump subunit AcrB
VVVNDSLVLIHAINARRSSGCSVFDAAVEGSVRRLRPVLLTSLTTFCGLAPMIFETSIQARFLVPMAAALGFGVLFVTVIALVIVPAGYILLEHARERLATDWRLLRIRERAVVKREP